MHEHKHFQHFKYLNLSSWILFPTNLGGLVVECQANYLQISSSNPSTISMGLYRWGDGMSRNDVSPYKFYGTAGRLDESFRKHNVPALKHPCHFAPT